MATQFHLPDLGEGIPEAEIHQWHVNVGDIVETDAVLVSMETAKAVVDVPAPFSGTITALHGKPGDVIHTGQPLVSYTTDGDDTNNTTTDNAIEQQATPAAISPTETISSTATQRHSDLIKTLPAVRVLATHLNVDLTTIEGSGNNGMITIDDVKRAASIEQTNTTSHAIPEGYTAITGVRRQMAQAMALSHKKVVPVTLCDDADLTSWSDGNDITVRMVRSIVYACKQEPMLNAWLTEHANAHQCHKQIDLGIAMDSADGLFVPVLRNAQSLTANAIRQGVDELKQAVSDRSISPELLSHPTITLSNFGMFAGRYATPIVVPPTVAIIAVGRAYTTLQQTKAGDLQQHRLLPISLTFDHRACTGGEAARFLKALLDDLRKKTVM